MIICCGEALIDMLPGKLVDGGEAFVPVPGGALFNTAIALGRLGEDAGFISGLSSDMFGQQLIAHLASSGVACDLCRISDHPTTLAFVNIVDGEASYSFFDENSAGRNFDISSLPDIPDNTSVLHFGGISLIGEPCGNAFEELINRHYQFTVISLDPNIRASFIQNEQAYRARLQRALAMSDIIKVSDDDLAWLRGGDCPERTFESAAQEWINNGASLVILTSGEKGARVLTGSHDISMPAHVVEIADTVGAGDAFNAGLLSALQRAGVLSKPGLREIDQNELRQALEFAVQVAAKTVARPGANPPWRNELDARA